MKLSFAGWTFCAFLGAMSLLFVTGCGETVTTHNLSGTVTYKGKPVPYGNIIISPDKDNKGPGTSAAIESGAFSTPENKGHVGGTYILLVSGYDGVPVKSGEGDMNPLGSPLFPPYQMTVDLPKEDHAIEIKIGKN